MKKLLLLSLTIIALSSFAPVKQVFEPHRQNGHRTGSPRYGYHDTVYNWRNHITYVIDSVQQGSAKHEVLYSAKTLCGDYFPRLNEKSIVRK